jgi:hypothetical protein
MPLLPEPSSRNDSDAPIAGVVPVELMTGDDDEDTRSFAGSHKMLKRIFVPSFVFRRRSRRNNRGILVQHLPCPTRRGFVDLDNRW